VFQKGSSSTSCTNRIARVKNPMTSPKQRQMNLEWWLEYKIYWNSVLHGIFGQYKQQTTNMTFVGGNLNLFLTNLTSHEEVNM
jgi:hypothetical protein